MFVEALRHLVLGINHQRKHTEPGSRNALQSVDQKNAAEALSLVRAGHGKPSQQHRGDYWIAGQSFDDVGGKLTQGKTGGRQSIVASHLLTIMPNRHKTGGDTPLNILRG